MDDISKALAELNTFVDAMSKIANNAVYVGVPQKESSRNAEEITNVELMYIHSKGSPRMNIPARPIIEPALNANKEGVDKRLLAAFNAYKKGEIEGDKELEKLGIYARDRCKAWFTDSRNGWAPNAPITIYGGVMHNPINGKLFYVKGKGEKKNRPLIDTGALRNSITYVIDKG